MRTSRQTITGKVEHTSGLEQGMRRDPARIAVALFLPIGDTIFAQPAIAALRRRFPQAHLTALVTASRAALAANMPEFDDVLMYNDTPAYGAIQRLGASLRAIWARRFDLLVSFNTSGNALAMLTGIPKQAWQRLPLGFWLWGATWDRAFRERHAIEHYLEIVAKLGAKPRGPEDHIPVWRVSEADRQAAGAQLAQAGVVRDPARPIIFLHPGAQGFGGRKRWPPSAFGDLAQSLIAQSHAQLVVLGGPEDREAAQIIQSATGDRAVVLAGQMTLRQSITLISQADAYIGCDSGLTHFAVALGTPTVAIFGYSDLTTFAPRPADPAHLRIVLPEPLPPPAGFFIGVESLLFPPRHPPDDRMSRITVAQVAEALTALLPGII